MPGENFKEKQMKYPVYIDGKHCGELNVYADGLMTVFQAQCRVCPKKPVRLYVFGGNEPVLLGTLQPHGSGSRLIRRFSRAELKRMPKRISFAADRQLGENTGETLWKAAGRGCLVSDDGFLAIPADARRLRRVSDKLRSINGKMYIIFKRKA